MDRRWCWNPNKFCKSKYSPQNTTSSHFCKILYIAIVHRYWHQMTPRDAWVQNILFVSCYDGLFLPIRWNSWRLVEYLPIGCWKNHFFVDFNNSFFIDSCQEIYRLCLLVRVNFQPIKSIFIKFLIILWFCL